MRLHTTIYTVSLLLIAVIVLAFSSGKKPIIEPLPDYFPTMKHPEGNELTEARVQLGRHLFYDPVLSSDSTLSCASCHKQSLAFADSVPVSPGVQQRKGNRNAPTLGNVGFNPTVLFDGFLETLEKQILVPIQEHAEFDFNMIEIVKRLKKDPFYVKFAKKAYNREPDPFVVTRSISAFERTLVSYRSDYDKFLQGKKKLSASAMRGKELFFNKLYCSNCHNGFNFTDFSVQNNGLYERYPGDSGRFRVTHLETDRDLFKVPSLRNISLTAPYMHDGSLPTLRDVIRHYASGGKQHKNKSPIIQPFTLTEAEENDLIAFLESLTDRAFLNDKRFSAPKKKH